MKRLFLLLLWAPFGIWAQTPTVTCAGGTNAVRENQSITCTSTSPVSWSLTGTGALTGSTTTSVTYTAPASVMPQNALAGWPVMPNDSIFNTRIDNLPLNPNSATWVSNVTSGNLAFGVGFGDTAWGISTSTASTPTRDLKNYYGGSTAGFPLSSGVNLKQEQGDDRSAADNQDHHVVNLRTDIGKFFEAYNIHSATYPSAGSCNGGIGFGCNVGGSVSYNWYDYTTNNGLSGTDAAGLVLAPLTPHLSEYYSGVINHALRFTSCLGCIYHGTYLWPASVANGSTAANSPPLGARFRLRLCGGSITTNCLTLSNYSAYQQVLLTALHNYGMILADIGSTAAAQTGTDVTLDRNVLNAINSLYAPIGDFDVVDETSLQYAPNSYETCPLNQTCMGGKNTYETPLNQAIITATPTGTGSAVSTSIAIQGVSIGLNSSILWIQAAPFSYQIPFWVNGTSNQNVTWSLTSGVGAVTSGGVYSPPNGIYGIINNSSDMELGERFKSDVDGYITGCRFFKASGDSSTHTCTLWSNSGTALATATFSGETASGWQQQNFSSAVAISANTLYAVTYHTSGNYYAAQEVFDGFSVDNGTLHAIQDGPDASGTYHTNGLLLASPGGVLPSFAPYKSNYLADVVFSTSSSGTSPLNIFTVATTPTVLGNAATLQAVSAADPNAVATVQVVVVPRSPGYVVSQTLPGAAIRIDSGSYSSWPTYDTVGNIWQPEGGLEQAGPGCCGNDFGWPSSDLEVPIYESVGYGNGSTNDFNYTFIVPNGNYRVKAMFGAGTGGPNGQVQTTIQPYSVQNSNVNLETQGTIIYHNWNYLLNNPAGYTQLSRTPSYIYVPAKVTNNVLQFASRSTFYDMDVINGGGTDCLGCKTPTINGLKIEPDPTPAHWAIDTQQQSTVTAGSSLWNVQTSGCNPCELGTAFVTQTPGYITGVRFYKPVGDWGTHTGTLWEITAGPLGSGTGTQLATGTFSGETASGWQTLTFGTPVAIAMGNQYVVSYHTTSGLLYYAPLFAPGKTFTNGTIVAYMGLAGNAAGTFPPYTSLNSYAVDPIFSLTSSGTNPVTLYSSMGLPGQQVQVYLQDWYTGLSDAQWSIVSGPGTIGTGSDISSGEPYAYYTAPSTQPDAQSVVLLQAQSASSPATQATTALYFTGAQPGVR